MVQQIQFKMVLAELPRELLEDIDKTVEALVKKEIGIQEFDNLFAEYTMRMNRTNPDEETICDFNHLYLIIKEDYVKKYGS